MVPKDKPCPDCGSLIQRYSEHCVKCFQLGERHWKYRKELHCEMCKRRIYTTKKKLCWRCNSKQNIERIKKVLEEL